MENLEKDNEVYLVTAEEAKSLVKQGYREALQWLGDAVERFPDSDPKHVIATAHNIVAYEKVFTDLPVEHFAAVPIERLPMIDEESIRVGGKVVVMQEETHEAWAAAETNGWHVTTVEEPSVVADGDSLENKYDDVVDVQNVSIFDELSAKYFSGDTVEEDLDEPSNLLDAVNTEIDNIEAKMVDPETVTPEDEPDSIYNSTSIFDSLMKKYNNPEPAETENFGDIAVDDSLDVDADTELSDVETDDGIQNEESIDENDGIVSATEETLGSSLYDSLAEHYGLNDIEDFGVEEKKLSTEEEINIETLTDASDISTEDEPELATTEETEIHIEEMSYPAAIEHEAEASIEADTVEEEPPVDVQEIIEEANEDIVAEEAVSAIEGEETNTEEPLELNDDIVEVPNLDDEPTVEYEKSTEELPIEELNVEPTGTPSMELEEAVDDVLESTDDIAEEATGEVSNELKVEDEEAAEGITEELDEEVTEAPIVEVDTTFNYYDIEEGTPTSDDTNIESSLTLDADSESETSTQTAFEETNLTLTGGNNFDETVSDETGPIAVMDGITSNNLSLVLNRYEYGEDDVEGVDNGEIVFEKTYTGDEAGGVINNTMKSQNLDGLAKAQSKMGSETSFDLKSAGYNPGEEYVSITENIIKKEAEANPESPESFGGNTNIVLPSVSYEAEGDIIDALPAPEIEVEVAEQMDSGKKKRKNKNDVLEDEMFVPSTEINEEELKQYASAEGITREDRNISVANDAGLVIENVVAEPASSVNEEQLDAPLPEGADKYVSPNDGEDVIPTIDEDDEDDEDDSNNMKPSINARQLIQDVKLLDSLD